MRQYRGKRIDNGEWVFGYFVDCRRDSYILPIHNADGEHPTFDERWLQEGSDDEGWIQVRSDTVGQSTGREDMNEKKIFKGDRLRCCMDIDLISGKRTYIEIVVTKECGCHLFPSGQVWIGGQVQAEIIGTIHD